MGSGGRLVGATGAAGRLRLFALSGIVTVLVTRAFLALTGYPRLGGAGGRLHIAHMLWGGLLMMAATLLALGLLGRPVRSACAVVGGVGFGLFIDEVGKQVTDEPGYFYRPAAGIIYATFAALLVLTRLLRHRAPLTAEQRSARAADLALTGVTSGLDEERRQAALRLVEGSERPVDEALVRLLRTLPERRPSAVRRRRAGIDRVTALLRRAARHRLVLALSVLCVLTEAVLFTLWLTLGALDGELAREPQRGALVGVLVSSLVATVLGAAGLVRLRTDRAAALRLVRAALLADILVGQIFKFTINQFASVTELAFDLCVLWVISVSATGPAPAGRDRRGDPLIPAY
ncbi:hypothetical protein [Streptomyces sp. SID13726]|uniref:hypothetical protein n=1 Tax=Streptomyces sp. SID13726 TaxID=2706058 RepID=UPI0013BC8B6A|nr:hypothetical protein [Streptomyces sp. SID13726]NEA99564.1 hypothetical protein [Streptomyces sp. SID13726]